MITQGHLLTIRDMRELCADEEQRAGMQAVMDMLAAYDEDETPELSAAERTAWLEQFIPKPAGRERFMVLCANNVDTDITVEGPFNTWQEARDRLTDIFSDYPADEGELESEAESMSFFYTDSNDFYYGRVERIPGTEGLVADMSKDTAPQATLDGVHRCREDWVVDGVLVCKAGKDYKFESAASPEEDGYCDILDCEDGKTLQTSYLEAGEYFFGL